MRDTFALLYALQDRLFTRLGRWVTNGVLICNGREVARAHASPRTVEIVSSTIRGSEFLSRTDTCRGSVVRILFVGFLRPEKGIEYLLDAVSQLKTDVPWELEIVGPRQFPDYCKKLEDTAAALGIRERIRWVGYVPNGKPLFDRMRAADLFGTTHALRGNAACPGGSSSQRLAVYFHHGRRRPDNGYGRIPMLCSFLRRLRGLWRAP